MGAAAGSHVTSESERRRSVSSSSGEDREDVVHEERSRLRIALLVAEAGAQHELPLGPRGADVEEVALALQTLLAHRQPQPARGGDRPAIGIRQERLRCGGARELTLLQAADQYGLKPPRPDRLRRGHLHAVGLRGLPRPHRQGREHVVHAQGVEPHARIGVQDATQLSDGLVRSTERAGIVQLGPFEDGGAAPVGPRKQPLQAPAERFQELRDARGSCKTVDHLETEGRDALLPDPSRTSERSDAPAAHVGLQPVGEPRLGQEPGRAQVGQQVRGAAVKTRATQQCEQAPPERGVGERHRAVDRVRDPVCGKDLFDGRGVGGGIAQHDHDLAWSGALAQEPQHLGAAQLGLGPLATGCVEPDRGPRLAFAGTGLKQPALERVERGARARRIVVVAGLEVLDPIGERGKLLSDPGGGTERLATRLVGQRDRDIGSGGACEHLEPVELDGREVVKAVNE